MSQPLENCPVLGVNYSAGCLDDAVSFVSENAGGLSGKYICFSNVHTTVMACDNENYKKILNRAALVFPDGQPIAKEQVKKGCSEAHRIAGPDFMDAMFKKTSDGSLSHYFYGSTEETLEKLVGNLNEKYKGIRIAGFYSPPFFKEITKERLEEDIKRINENKPDLVWIGLGAPKQEVWMNRAKGLISGVCLGVGAGFSFHAGTAKRAPVVLQKAGLEWFYRLCQDPKRLFKRYFVTNTKFLWYTKIKKM